MNNADRPHRSPSQIGSYLRCGEAWRRIYLEHERPPPFISMLTGTGMHKGAQVNFEQKIESHVDLPVPQIVDAAVAGFDAAVAKDGVTLTDKEKPAGQEMAVGAARDNVAKLAAAFAIMQAPDYQPIAVEQRVRIPVPRSTHDLLGVMDFVGTVRGVTGQRVRDWKTGKRKKSAVDAAESTQLTFYAAAHQVHYGAPPADVGLDVLIIKSKGIERQELVEQRDEKDFQALAATLNTMERGIKAGIFLPAVPDAYWCRSCVFRPTCPYVNNARVEAAKAAEEE